MSDRNRRARERPGTARKEQILTQPEPSKVRRTADAIVLKEGRPFLLTTEGGDVPWQGAHGLGLFYNDCRFLDGYTLRVNGRALAALAADDSRGFETHHHLTNHRLPAGHGNAAIPRRTLTVHRTRVMRAGVVHETIEIVHRGRADVRVTVELRFRAKFEDIFVVKGFVSPARGTLRPPQVREPDALELVYRGRDAITRRTVVTFVPAPTRLEGGRASFALTLRHAEAATLGLTILPREDERDPDRHAASVSRLARSAAHARRHGTSGVLPVVLGARLLATGIPIRLLTPFLDFEPHTVKILTWAGVRGGISVALALSIRDRLPAGTADVLLVMTYMVVVFSVVGQGLTMRPVLRRYLASEGGNLRRRDDPGIR